MCSYVVSVLYILADLGKNEEGTFNGDDWKSFIDTLSMTDEGIPLRGEMVESLKTDDDLLTQLVHFYHMYVVHVRDLDVIKGKLCDEISVFDIVTPSDASWASVTFVDNFNGWKDTIQKMESGEINAVPSVNDTRWKKCRGKRKFSDRVGTQARDFYMKCMVLFSVVQDGSDDMNGGLKEELDELSRKWWKDNGAGVIGRKRKAPNRVTGDKGRVQAAVVNDAALLSFNILLKNIDRGSGGAIVSDGSAVSSLSELASPTMLLPLLETTTATAV